MGSYRNWTEFKQAMGIKNENARTQLQVIAKERTENSREANRALTQLKSHIVRTLQGVIPPSEKTGSGCCAIVSIEDLCAVQSLNPSDYMVKTQVDLIIDSLMKCKSVSDLLSAIQQMEADGEIFNGTRFLQLKASIRFVILQYIVPADNEYEYIAV